MQKAEPSALLASILLIGSGLLSRSNGIDDAVNISMATLASRSLHILFFTVFAYLMINLLTVKKQP